MACHAGKAPLSNPKTSASEAPMAASSAGK
jgi:hypothetical protein